MLARPLNGALRAGPAPLSGLESLGFPASVWVVEEEEDRAALQEFFPQNPVVCWDGGDFGIEHTDWGPLKGRKVILYPRADDMGRDNMVVVAHCLRALAGEVSMVDPIGVPLGWGPKRFLAQLPEREDGIIYLRNHIEAVVFPPPSPRDEPDDPEPPEVPQEPSEPPPATPALAKAPQPKPSPVVDWEGAFEAIALSDISDEVRAQVVQNLFEAGSVGVMAGSPNAGKTFLAVHLGIHVAAGRPWFGAKVARGPVVYVAAEAPGSVKRRAKLAAAHAFPFDRLPFYVVSASPSLGSEAHTVADVARLIATLAKIASEEGEAVKLLIIDTVASVLGDGEENSDGMLLLAGAAKHIARETGVSVVLIHHPNKADPRSLRGHGSLAAAVDAILVIETDENTGIRTATLTKSRDSDSGRQVFFKLESVPLPGVDYFGDAHTSCVVVAAEVPEHQKRRPRGKAQDTLLIELERRYREGALAWDRATVMEAGKSLGLHRNSARQAIMGLQKAGFVVGGDASLTLKHPPTDD